MITATTPQKTVMVVEDEPVIRGLLCMTLEGENYRVESAEDGREALDKVGQVLPDAILLDLMLPNMDGWSLIAALSERSETERIPIIAVSAAQRGLNVGERGVHAFLSKPFDVDILLIALEDALHQAETMVLAGRSTVSRCVKSTSHQPASGPAPTNVGQAPQSSVTVKRVINAPPAVRRITNVAWVAPAG